MESKMVPLSELNDSELDAVSAGAPSAVGVGQAGLVNVGVAALVQNIANNNNVLDHNTTVVTVPVALVL